MIFFHKKNQNLENKKYKKVFTFLFFILSNESLFFFYNFIKKTKKFIKIKQKNFVFYKIKNLECKKKMNSKKLWEYTKGTVKKNFFEKVFP